MFFTVFVRYGASGVSADGSAALRSASPLRLAITDWLHSELGDPIHKMFELYSMNDMCSFAIERLGHQGVNTFQDFELHSKMRPDKLESILKSIVLEHSLRKATHESEESRQIASLPLTHDQAQRLHESHAAMRHAADHLNAAIARVSACRSLVDHATKKLQSEERRVYREKKIVFDLMHVACVSFEQATLALARVDGDYPLALDLIFNGSSTSPPQSADALPQPTTGKRARSSS